MQKLKVLQYLLKFFSSIAKYENIAKKNCEISKVLQKILQNLKSTAKFQSIAKSIVIFGAEEIVLSCAILY